MHGLKGVIGRADFNGSKTLDEIVFSFISSWVRVANLPMGLRNSSTSKVIGDEVGEFMEMESESDECAAIEGKSL